MLHGPYSFKLTVLPTFSKLLYIQLCNWQTFQLQTDSLLHATLTRTNLRNVCLRQTSAITASDLPTVAPKYADYSVMT